MTTSLSPASILQTGFSFWSAKVLLTAVEFGVFGQLANSPRTGAELGVALGLHPRGIADFFDALLAMGFLQRDGNGEGARYRNSDEAEHFLVPGKPAYLGGILAMLNARLFRFWNDLPIALRTGRPQNETKDGGGGGVFEAIYQDPAGLEQFLGAMTGLSRGNFATFADRFDFKPYRTLLDLGGATGLLAIEVAKRHPHLTCTTFDLPPVEPIARRHIAAAGLGLRVRAVAGDFFADKLPTADVITMGMILHDWNLAKKRLLIQKAYDALPPGGALVTIEALIDDERRHNAFGLLMSLNMLIEFGDAFDYSAADFRSWCEPIGFTRFETIALGPTHGAAIAWKGEAAR